MAAAKYNLGNLVAILDNNGFQQNGPVEEVMPSLKPIAKKWEAFGWHTAEVDGHDMPALLDTFGGFRQVPDKPKIMIADTSKGKGLEPFLKDNVNRKHGEALSQEEAQQALAQIDQIMSKA